MQFMQFWKGLKKFRVISGIYIKKQIAYRLNFLTPYILRVFQLVGSIVVWKALFKNHEVINGYTFNNMISYLLFAQFALLVFYPSHMFSLQELVRKGTLSGYLLRPCHYMLNSWSEFFGVKCVHLLFFILIFIFMSFWTGFNQHFGLKQMGIFNFHLSLLHDRNVAYKKPIHRWDGDAWRNDCPFRLAAKLHQLMGTLYPIRLLFVCKCKNAPRHIFK